MPDPRLKPTDRVSADAQWGSLGNQWNNQIGQSGELLRPGDRAELVRIIGEDQLAKYVTVSCDLSPVIPIPEAFVPQVPDLNAQYILPPVKGIVQWGNGGVICEAEFDFSNSTVISVAASSVRVVAELERQSPDEELRPPVRVKAHVDYLPRASHAAQRTILSPEIGPGETTVFPLAVPKYAKRVRVTRYPGQAIGFLLISPVDGPVATAITDGPIDLPVPDSARFWAALNLDDVNPTVVFAVFDLWI